MKTRRIRIVIIVAGFILALLLAGSALAASNGTCGADGDNVTWVLDNGTLTISGTGSMCDYGFLKEPYSPWFDNESVTKVVVENGVTYIGATAFFSLYNVNEVILPNSVTRIGRNAFMSTAITSIRLPSNLVSIDDEAFASCYELSEIVFPDSLVNIGPDAFQYCESLTSVLIPKNVTNIQGGPFPECKNLTHIDVAEENPRYKSVDGILYSKDGTELVQCPATKTNIVIPEGVTHIASNGLFRCLNITNMVLPDSVTDIGNRAFFGCRNMTSITLNNGLVNIGREAFDATGLTGIVMPDSVRSIGDNAFYCCYDLSSITLNNGLISIGDGAFSGAFSTGITSIVLPESLKSIGSSAFSDQKFESVIIPDGVENIGEHAFSSPLNPFVYATVDSSAAKALGKTGQMFSTLDSDIDYRLRYTFDGETLTGLEIYLVDREITSITIPECVTSICDMGFCGCSNLTSIVIPQSVTKIGDYAFEDCTSLKDVTILGDVSCIEKLTFYCCTGLENIHLPQSLTTIGASAFYNCYNLNKVSLPDHITSIDETAFKYSYPSFYAKPGSDTAITLGRMDKYFNIEGKPYSLKCVFADGELSGLELYSVDWYSDETIYITDDVTCVAEDIVNAVANHWINGKSVYADLDSVAAQTLSKAGIAFKPLECNYKLRYLFTEETITGLELVEADDDVINILVPSGVTSIADNAFLWCGNLKIITISATVNSIGENAFRNCWRLEKVVFLTKDVEQEVVFGNQAFYYYSSMQFYCYRYTDPAIWCVQNQMPVIYLDDVGIDSIRTVEIQQEDFRMACGDTAELTVNMFPADGTEIVWTSSTPEVVGVEDGIVTALTEGTATITASVGQVSDSIVINTYIAATGFRLSETEMWIIVDDGSIQLDTVDFEPEGASATITWASSDTRYATVDNTGLVMPYKPGEVLITATTEKGISKQCLLHMCYPVSGVSLIAPQNALLMGDDMQLTANVTMNTQSCINHLVSFTSSDESIATVDSETGLLHAIAPGRVTITAASKNDKSSSISIKVNFDLEGRQILHLPADLQEIGAEAFSGLACEAVIIPDSCTTIGERAFAGCDQLLYVYIPTSVTNISADAFDGCDNAVFEYEHE